MCKYNGEEGGGGGGQGEHISGANFFQRIIGVDEREQVDKKR